VGKNAMTKYHIWQYNGKPADGFRLNLSALLISHGTVFFSHNKTASAGLSAA